MNAFEKRRARSGSGDHDCDRLGRPVRRRQVGARARRLVPAHDDPLCDRGRRCGWPCSQWFEGRRSLLLDGHGLRLFWLGTLGFAGFNLLAYTGLAHARPESASLIVALAPLLTALVLWHRTGTRPSATTFALLGVALAGVALVISRGHPTAIVDGALGWGDALVLGGVLQLRHLRARRRAVPGLLGAPLHDADRGARLGQHRRWQPRSHWPPGWLPMPTSKTSGIVTPQIAYLALPGAVIAVLAWNEAIRLIGAQNTFLFGNLIPVTTFAIEIVRGYRPSARRARRRCAHDRRARREQPARPPQGELARRPQQAIPATGS